MREELASQSLLSHLFVILGIVLMVIHLDGMSTILNREKPNRTLISVWLFGLVCSSTAVVVGILMTIRQFDVGLR